MVLALIFIVAAQLSVILSEDAAQEGIDVNEHNTKVNWSSVKSNGICFAYVKATGGIEYKNKKFSDQWAGASKAGLLRGAFHVARPIQSSGAEQADHFVANGGDWTDDGKTLPGAVDLSEVVCNGKSTSNLVSWVKDFSSTYKNMTGRFPVIYTSTNWWNLCMGMSTELSDCPLWLAHYAAEVGALPGSWTRATIWQYADKGKSSVPGNANKFMGGLSDLQKFAKDN